MPKRSCSRSRSGVRDRRCSTACGFGLPRVEAHVRYEAPVRMGTTLRVGIDPRIENPRRLRYTFEMSRECRSACSSC